MIATMPSQVQPERSAAMAKICVIAGGIGAELSRSCAAAERSVLSPTCR